MQLFSAAIIAFSLTLAHAAPAPAPASDAGKLDVRQTYRGGPGTCKAEVACNPSNNKCSNVWVCESPSSDTSSICNQGQCSAEGQACRTFAYQDGNEGCATPA